MFFWGGESYYKGNGKLQAYKQNVDTDTCDKRKHLLGRRALGDMDFVNAYD